MSGEGLVCLLMRMVVCRERFAEVGESCRGMVCLMLPLNVYSIPIHIMLNSNNIHPTLRKLDSSLVGPHSAPMHIANIFNVGRG